MKNIDIESIVECAEKRSGQQFQFVYDYAEPGYSAERGIVLGNWNPKCGFSVPKEEQRRDAVSKLGRVLESLGFELEWEDEWTTCCDCGKAVRTSGDCYSWTPHYVWTNDCEIVCLDCLDTADYLTSIEDDPNKACPPGQNPEEHGYTKFNGDFETGWHPGQNDKPADILKRMHALSMSGVVFKIAEQSQFYTVWQAYYRVSE